MFHNRHYWQGGSAKGWDGWSILLLYRYLMIFRWLFWRFSQTSRQQLERSRDNGSKEMTTECFPESSYSCFIPLFLTATLAENEDTAWELVGPPEGGCSAAGPQCHTIPISPLRGGQIIERGSLFKIKLVSNYLCRPILFSKFRTKHENYLK